MTIAATCAFDEAAEIAWDVVVVGAGPAGSAAALQLARRRRRVLIVERKAFPRTKVCGGCVSAAGVRLLEAWGVADVLKDRGARPLISLRICSENRQATLRLAPGLSVSRESLDAALVRAAIDAGAHFLPATTAQVGPWQPSLSRRSVTLSAAGESAALNVPLVIAADGLGHPSLRLRDEFSEEVAPASYLGGGAILAAGDAVATRGALAPDGVTMCVAPGGYVGIVEVEEGRLNIAAALAPSLVKEAGSLAAAAARIVEQSGVEGSPAILRAPWLGTPALTRRTRPLAREGVLLLGDAAGYVEPFTGEGITWALASAVELADVVTLASDTSPRALARRWRVQLSRTMNRRARVCRAVSQGLRRPWLVRRAVQALGIWPIAAAPVVEWVTQSHVPLKTKDTR